MSLAPFVYRWRLLAAVLLLAAAVTSPALAQGERNPVMYILMGDNYFLPASVTIRARTTVVWINQGSTVHQVRSALWDSGPMVPGQAFWRTFDIPGEYWFTDPRYTDDGMNGYITIQSPPVAATRTPVARQQAAAPAPAAAAAPAAQPSPTSAATATPRPAAPEGTPATTPGALASPAAGTPTARPTGQEQPATQPGAGATVVPGPTPGALAPTAPDSGAPAPAAEPDGASGTPTEPSDLPLPESRTLPTEDGAGFPLPLLGGWLFLLGLVSSHRLRRSGR